MIYRIVLIVFCLIYSNTQRVIAQSKSPDPGELTKLVEQYKADQRGPYKDIRWFCKDGTFNDPKVPCNQEGSIQRARYKDEVQNLRTAHHLFLGQILAGTDFKEFWDEKNFQDQFKQYQLEQYLRATDNGWINRNAQFYRGAFQVEDEMKWGKDFLNDLLSQDETVIKKYFILRQAVATLPHDEDDNVKQKVRAVSKTISDVDQRFMKLRIKIHGNPERGDIRGVEDFLQNTRTLDPAVKSQLADLVSMMKQMYAPIDLDRKIAEVSKLPESIKVRNQCINAFQRLKEKSLTHSTLVAVIDAMAELRKSLLTVKSASRRLSLMDLSVDLENIVLQRLPELGHANLGELNAQICQLGYMAYSTGYLEEWEWNYLESQLSACQSDNFDLYQLIEFHENAKYSVEWGANMVRANYNPTINLFGQFEPLSYGLIDDIVRSSSLLFLGQKVGELGNWLNAELKYSNQVMDIAQSSQIRGLNAGYAKGKLEVVSGDIENLQIDKSKIYIFDQPPSDLKPIAGIATVSEGNPVSHIQLLARNLGIPNAVISLDDFNKLKKFRDMEVFYAVSPTGTVILKNASDLTPIEQKLFAVKSRPDEKIEVPIDRLELSNKDILNLRNLDKHSSGIYCGPKAANLGELKKLFPEKVVEGIVIPFGLFKSHMDQRVPGKSFTYWNFVNETFTTAKNMVTNGDDQNVVEKYQLDRLSELRGYIKNIPLLPDFESNLKRQFSDVFKKDLGNIPVFLRSDTNMEDLKDFTGAGLNLTLFNVRSTQDIIQGIKDVWASPYSERSFKWRQKFLLNPENVFPSILIIPGVNVDYSGVLITKGLKTNDYKDLTVAFNRGVGGAVDGQAAESYTLHHNGYNYLNAPSREIKYKYLLDTGGTADRFTDFSTPVLKYENLKDIRDLATEAIDKIKFSEDINQTIAHDIEFGFLGNKIWLFQVRPFVENKNALGSEYLNSISPPLPKNKSLNHLLKI